MKRLLITILILAALCIPAKANDLRFWFLTERSFNNESNMLGRIGWETGDFLLKEPENSIELFVGSTWMLML